MPRNQEGNVDFGSIYLPVRKQSNHHSIIILLHSLTVHNKQNSQHVHLSFDFVRSLLFCNNIIYNNLILVDFYFYDAAECRQSRW